ncbi:hypothetical protein C8Q80DRAFT_1119794 [Daedaleopsis nitida]|nr:hypothetical protein C8Q80DRAFT_1119794 [Daedaleopsis nitida]
MNHLADYGDDFEVSQSGSDVHRCVGDDDLDACGKLFPLKDHPGLCAQCDMLKRHEGNNTKTQQILASTNAVTYCGKHRTLYSAGFVEHLGRTSTERLRCVGDAKVSTTSQLGSQETDLRLIYVRVIAQLDKKFFHYLGRVGRSYPANKPLPEIIEDYLRTWNDDFWTKHSQASLTRKDVSLRWEGNIVPEYGSEMKTLGEFYDIHRVQPHWITYFDPKIMKSLKAKENGGLQCVCLELLIDVDGGKNSKRTRSESSNASKGAKHPKRGHVPSIESIELLLASISLNPVTHTLDVSWETMQGAKECSTSMSDSVTWSGKTKYVYTLYIRYDDGKPLQAHVAKRFFNIGGGKSFISCADNARFLQLDAERLLLGKLYLDMFYDHAANQDAEVAKVAPLDFAFTECLIAREMTSPGPNEKSPSTASGISAEKWKSDWPLTDWDMGIVWLVEPQRSALVDRWSGTLVQVHRENKRSATMAAFAHYSMLASEYSLVFVDLQSSYGSLPTGSGDGHVLFDLMTHTISGESGMDLERLSMKAFAAHVDELEEHADLFHPEDSPSEDGDNDSD